MQVHFLWLENRQQMVFEIARKGLLRRKPIRERFINDFNDYTKWGRMVGGNKYRTVLSPFKRALLISAYEKQHDLQLAAMERKTRNVYAHDE